MNRTVVLVSVLACGCGFNTNDPFDDAPVVSLEEAPPPIAGGTLAATRDGRLAIVADADRDRVVLVDLETREVRAIALERGVEPGRVVEDGTHAYVALRRGGAVLAIDLASAAVTARYDVCRSPRGLAWEGDTDRLHVACADGALVTLGPDRAVERTLLLPPDLRDVVVGSDGLLVSRFRSAEILRVTSAGVMTGAQRLPIARLEGVDAVGDPSGLAQDYAPNVAVRLAPAPSGAVVLHQRSRIGPEVVFEGSSGSSSGYTYSNEAVTNDEEGTTWRDPCQNAVVHAAATFVDSNGTALHTAPSIVRGVVPIDAAVSTSGQLAVAFAGEPGGPYVYGPQVVTSARTTAMRDDQGGCLASERGDRFAGQVVAVAFAGETPLVQIREPAALVIDGESIALGGESVRDTGHDIFHLDTGGAIACASCHPGGGDDGHVWEFAATRRIRTMPLEGIIGLTPYHRGGDVPSFSALMEDLREQMAGPPLEADALGAVEHWLRRLPTPPAGPVIDEDAVARGRELFERSDVACTSCHAGELGTDGLSHAIDGEMWQTPALHGVALRAPYLHDGRAAFTGAGSHGATSHLSEVELADLEAYVRAR